MTAAWLQELESPSEAFFQVFADRVRQPNGAHEAACEALVTLIPRIDWAGYLPHCPHGVLGLAAAFQLETLLSMPSFLRLLATQLHAFAREGRAHPGKGLQAVSRGSGHWPHVELALTRHESALAWGETQGLEKVLPSHFEGLLVAVQHDMANLGHKAVLVHQMTALNASLGQDVFVGRPLLGLAGWQACAEPVDHFWVQRIRKRLQGPLEVPHLAAQREADFHAECARLVCDAGLAQLFDAVGGWLNEGLGAGDLLAILVRAAAEKLVDARRDLEGRTAWTLSYLAMVAEALPTVSEAWAQAAALINFFPSEEPEDRLQPASKGASGDALEALTEAILDGEIRAAMACAGLGEAQGVLRVLAEAAARNDPGPQHSAQILAVAASAKLANRVPAETRSLLLAALAKFLASAQGSEDLGRRASAALK